MDIWHKEFMFFRPGCLFSDGFFIIPAGAKVLMGYKVE